MLPEKITFRLTPADAANLNEIAATLRTPRDFRGVSLTAAIQTALKAAAKLARAGMLAEVLASPTAGGAVR